MGVCVCFLVCMHTIILYIVIYIYTHMYIYIYTYVYIYTYPTYVNLLGSVYLVILVFVCVCCIIRKFISWPNSTEAGTRCNLWPLTKDQSRACTPLEPPVAARTRHILGLFFHRAKQLQQSSVPDSVLLW